MNGRDVWRREVGKRKGRCTNGSAHCQWGCGRAGRAGRQGVGPTGRVSSTEGTPGGQRLRLTRGCSRQPDARVSKLEELARQGLDQGIHCSKGHAKGYSRIGDKGKEWMFAPLPSMNESPKHWRNTVTRKNHASKTQRPQRRNGRWFVGTAPHPQPVAGRQKYGCMRNEWRLWRRC